jgi:hypothetical protein
MFEKESLLNSLFFVKKRDGKKKVKKIFLLQTFFLAFLSFSKDKGANQGIKAKKM